MDQGAGHPGLLVSAAIRKVVRKLHSHLSNHRDSYKGTMKMLDLLEDKVQILCGEHLLHLKPDKELAVAEWLWRLNKATNEAEALLKDMETEVNIGASNTSHGVLGKPDLTISQAIYWLRSDNDNLVRMKITIGRLASICAEGGSIVDISNLEESHLAVLNKENTSLPSDISRNETKPSPDGAFVIGRDEEITMILDMVLGDARYVTSSLEGREESDTLQISQKGWIVETLEHIDLLDTSQLGSEVAPYQSEIWNKVHYTRMTHRDTVTDLRNPTVIPIVGIGGVGKTALAQLTFNDERVQKHFGNQSAWVNVTDNMSEEVMIERIIVSFIPQHALTLFRRHDLCVKLQSIVQGRRFLLVLDDVWGDICAIWSKLRMILSKGAPGSVVLVTTQLYEVASFMGTTCPVVLDPLQSDILWKLMEHYAFADPCNPQYSEALEPIGRTIAAKLHGLPLAAKTIGASLRNNVDEDCWNRLLKSWWWKISLNILCVSIGIGYSSLPGYLRQCFLFFSIFPRNYVFEKCKLSQMWSVNGFIQPNNVTSSGKLEDIAGQWFDELVNRAFLEPSVCKTGFVMHDLVRDFAIALCSNEFRGVKTVEDASQILHYLSSELDDLNVQLADFEIRELKPIMLFAEFDQSSSSEVDHSLHRIEEKPKRLCILDFSCSRWCGARAYSVPEGAEKHSLNAISRLKHLRYLDLSFTAINTLPHSVCSLYHLQVLDLRGCFIRRLPRKMNSLINLHHLHASSDTISQINGIGKLTKLQELHEFCVKAEDGHRITELRDLNDIRGSLCISKLEMVTDTAEALEANIVEKDYLTALELRWSNYLPKAHAPDLTMSILRDLCPPRYLQELKLHGYLGFAFPNWVRVGQLNHVRVLEISSCENLQSLPPLGQFENLQKLKLDRLLSIKDINFKAYGTSNVVFRSLEELSFERMEEWENWTYAGGREIFPNLQKLRIYRCRELKELPFESLGSTTKEIYIGLYGLKHDIFSRYLQRLTGLSRLEVLHSGFDNTGKLILPCKQLRSLEYLYINVSCEVCIKGEFLYLRNLKGLWVRSCEKVTAELDEDLPLAEKHVSTERDLGMHSLTHLTLDRLSVKTVVNILPKTPSLGTLHLEGICDPTDIHEMWLEQLTSLQELEINWCEVLPSSLTSLSSLKKLTLNYCTKIHSILPNILPGNMIELQIKGCSLELVARCQNPNGEIWLPGEDEMDEWRRDKLEKWHSHKIEYGRMKFIELRRKKKEYESLITKRVKHFSNMGGPVRSAEEASLQRVQYIWRWPVQEMQQMEEHLVGTEKDNWPGKGKEKLEERLVSVEGDQSNVGEQLNKDEEGSLEKWLQQNDGDQRPLQERESNSWLRKKLEEALISNKEGPSGLMKEREKWLKEQEQKMRAPLGKDWPNIAHVPYIYVNGRIVQNLYT